MVPKCILVLERTDPGQSSGMVRQWSTRLECKQTETHCKFDTGHGEGDHVAKEGVGHEREGLRQS